MLSGAAGNVPEPPGFFKNRPDGDPEARVSWKSVRERKKRSGSSRIDPATLEMDPDALEFDSATLKTDPGAFVPFGGGSHSAARIHSRYWGLSEIELWPVSGMIRKVVTPLAKRV